MCTNYVCVSVTLVAFPLVKVSKREVTREEEEEEERVARESMGTHACKDPVSR